MIRNGEKPSILFYCATGHGLGLGHRLPFWNRHLDPDQGAVGTTFQWQDGKRVVVYPPKIAMGKIKFPQWMIDYWKIKE